MSYGCFNRKPFVEGHYVGRGLLKYWIPFRMSRDCEYAKDDKYADKGCVGCKWKENPNEARPASN